MMSLRVVSLAIIVTVLLSCQSPTNKEDTSIAIHNDVDSSLADQPSSKEKTGVTVEINGVVEFVEQNATKREFGRRKVERQYEDSIPAQFIDRYLSGRSFGPKYESKIYRDPWPSNFWNDYFHSDQFFFFSFIQDDEYCCHTLYGVTVNPEKDSISDLFQMALSGADGGWVEEDIFEWKNDTTFLVRQNSFYDELLMENDSTKVHFDTTWVTIYIDSNGKFNREVTDSVSDVQELPSDWYN